MGTLPELFDRRAVDRGGALAYRFLIDGETEEQRICYAELRARARAIAAELCERVGSGERVILVHPPGLEFIAAFVACSYAGVVAVPAYPPDPGRGPAGLERLVGIIEDSRAAMLLSTAAVCGPLRAVLSSDVPVLASDRIEERGAGGERRRVAPGDPAFLQYTSGSTSAPKGVVVSHANVLANLAHIHASVARGPESSFVLWLPPYHDMGLMNMLYAAALGCSCTSMSPIDFLRRPLRWLQAITRYRADYSGGPDFGYAHCLRKIDEHALADLDLSSWAVAFDGAEPIDPDVLRRFAARFAGCGFRLGRHGRGRAGRASLRSCVARARARAGRG